MFSYFKRKTKKDRFFFFAIHGTHSDGTEIIGRCFVSTIGGFASVSKVEAEMRRLHDLNFVSVTSIFEFKNEEDYKQAQQ